VVLFSASAVTGCYTGSGKDFRANVSVTEKGFVCQAWNVTKPRYHLLSPEDHPEIGGGHNFCRNPGGQKEKPWCFTTNSDTKFDFCDIPRCGEISKLNILVMYSSKKFVLVYNFVPGVSVLKSTIFVMVYHHLPVLSTTFQVDGKNFQVAG